MTIGLIDEKSQVWTVVEDDTDALLARADWRNYYFAKSGRSLRGAAIWPTKKSAADAAAINEAKMQAERSFIYNHDGLIDYSDYQYSMQLPELGQ